MQRALRIIQPWVSPLLLPFSPSLSLSFYISSLDYVRATLGGDAVLPCLFRHENKYSVTDFCPVYQCFMSPLKLPFQWQEDFGFPWEESAALGSQEKLENTTPTNPNIRKQKSAQNQILPKHCVPLVEGHCSRSVQSPVLLWFISRFWGKMSHF